MATEADAFSAISERLNQAIGLLQEMHRETSRERDIMKQSVSTLLDHLESMQAQWDTAERMMASAARMEGELRESVREAHRLLDKMPGKRHY